MTYRTIFGPSVAHNGVIYAKTDANLRLAFRRLTCLRGPLDSDPITNELYDRHLQWSQRSFVHNHSHIFAHLRHLYTPHFTSYTNAEDEADEHHSDPHPKKLLRIQAWSELCESGVRFDPLWLTQLKIKMKPNEIAKPGKYPRCIADLGVAASLQGFRVTNFLKTATEAEPFTHLDGLALFCKSPDPSSLKAAFDGLIDPPCKYFFTYFSDDSCISIRHSDGTISRYNLDISSCDTSHTPHLFDALVQTTPLNGVADMRALVKQCELPVAITSRDTKSARTKLVSRGPVLFSGSTLTTAINNLATILIFIAIVESRASCAASIIDAAARAGYVITLQHCAHVEDIQFLKHSPVAYPGGWYPVLNLGVLLRSMGRCNGDLPGRGDLAARARDFHAAFLHGMYPYTRFTLINNLLSKTPHAYSIATASQVTAERGYTDTPDVLTVVDSVSLYLRYRLSPHEIAELEENATRACFETQFSCAATRKILALDYGLE